MVKFYLKYFSVQARITNTIDGQKFAPCKARRQLNQAQASGELSSCEDEELNESDKLGLVN